MHARIVARTAGRLERLGWQVTTEAQIGNEVPRGWIDILGFRPADAAALVVEVKGDIPDAGALQRQTSFYTRSALDVAAGLGWRAERVALLVAALDSESIAARLAANRDLLRRAYPGNPAAFEGWLRRGGEIPPATIAAVDPAARSGRWLRSTSLWERRSIPAYRDYADAAAGLRTRR